jgi:ribosome-associated translation inhibitor RaiA
VQLRVQSEDPAVPAQVEQLVRFYESSLSDATGQIALHVAVDPDPLGTMLYDCRIHARLVTGETLEIEERQADLVIGVTRALDRCVRTIRRRGQARRLSP